MHRLPRDVLSLLVECLLPCERRVVRRTCWAWRLWPNRTRCEGEPTTRRRPGPVINVRPLVPLVAARCEPLCGGEAQQRWWWGSGCRTVVVWWRRRFPGFGPDGSADAAVGAWLQRLLCDLVPACEYLITGQEFAARLNVHPLPRGVVLVDRDCQQSRTGPHCAPFAEIADAPMHPLVPWGRLRSKAIPADMDPAKHLIKTDDSMYLTNDQLRLTEIHEESYCGSHEFWNVAEMSSCRSLTYTLDCDPSACEHDKVPKVPRAWPALREVVVEYSDDADEASESSIIRPCVRQLTMIAETAPCLRKLGLNGWETHELAMICEAIGRRQNPNPVALDFSGSAEELFSIVLGCVGDSTRVDPGHAFARGKLIPVSIHISDRPPKEVSNLRRLIEVYESNGSRVRAAAANLYKLMLRPGKAEATASAFASQHQDAELALCVFAALPRVAYLSTDNVGKYHCRKAEEFRSNPDLDDF